MYDDLPDHPDIRKMEMYGTLQVDMNEREAVYCPFCGRECDTIYLDKNGDAVGCDQCIQTEDAFDWADNQDE